MSNTSPPRLVIPCVPLRDCVGKTIAAVHEPWRSLIVVRFTDSTLACLQAEPDDDDDDEASLTSRSTIPVGEFLGSELVNYGLATAEQLAAHNTANAAWKDSRREATERAEFERLRAKFGGAS